MNPCIDIIIFYEKLLVYEDTNGGIFYAKVNDNKSFLREG